MNASSISGTMAVAAMALQLQTLTQMQTAVVRQAAESHQQLAQMLAEFGIGQNIDTHA